MDASTSTCLINVDGINYKVDLSLNNGETKVDLDYLKTHLASLDDDLAKCDIFDSAKYILEIFDPNFKEFVQIDDSAEVKDRSKLRARRVESNNMPNKDVTTNGWDNHELDQVLLVKDFEDKRNLVNIIIKLHKDFPKATNRRKGRRVSYLIDENLRLKEKFWSTVADEMVITCNKSFDGKTCLAMFFSLLAQYQYVLQKYKRYTEEKVQEIWPFFKAFHYKIDSKLFARGFNTLKGNFDNCAKDGRHGKDDKNKRKTDIYSRLEVDFNLVLTILARIQSFSSKKSPRAAIWKTISVDMGEYDLPDSCMAALRWQKRFHELLRKYLELSRQGTEEEKQAWPLYNLLSQIDVELFLTIKETTENDHDSPIPIDVSDSDNEFLVIDEITDNNDNDENDIIMIDNDEEIDDVVLEVINDIINQIIETDDQG